MAASSGLRRAAWLLAPWRSQRDRLDFYHGLLDSTTEDAVMGSESKLALVWGFLRTRKKWWLSPVVVILILMGLLIVLTESSAVAPFIYALF